MALGLELDYRLRWLDFDRHGRMQPFAILDIFQDVATIQAEQMGIGRADMLDKGVFWAVVRMKYEIVRGPERYQVVRARTWPHTPTSFSFLRDFTLSDEDGDTLVKATSEWVLMDARTRKFAKMKDHYDGPFDFSDDRAFERKPRKLADFDGEDSPAYVVVPAYSDIDLNGHVNNARYLAYVVDALSPGRYGTVKSLQIDFRHEVMPGSPLAIHTRIADGRALAKGIREDGDTAFACAIDLA